MKLGKQLLNSFKPVSSVNLRTPTDKEYHRQKSGKGFCNHLKGTYKETGRMSDFVADEVYDIEKEFCKICKKEITFEMKKEINRKLRNFKKGKEVGEAVGEALKKL